MKNLRYVYILIALFLGTSVVAQNTRISDHNIIGWYGYFGTFKLNSKFSLHTEYQWRRTDLVQNWQQGLLRVGLNYQLHPSVQLRAGYAWIETFAYGDIPINGLGRDFTERRTWQMATLTNKVGIIDLSHRFLFEQRWVGRYSDASLEKEDDFVFLNRLRYMLRLQVPLKGNAIVDGTPYFVFYNETFVGFGQNVGENIFDQNRVGLMLGYRFSNKFRLEAGYLSQISLFGREINGASVVQYNNGLIITGNFNFDFSKS